MDAIRPAVFVKAPAMFMNAMGGLRDCGQAIESFLKHFLAFVPFFLVYALGYVVVKCIGPAGPLNTLDAIITILFGAIPVVVAVAGFLRVAMGPPKVGAKSPFAFSEFCLAASTIWYVVSVAAIFILLTTAISTLVSLLSASTTPTLGGARVQIGANSFSASPLFSFGFLAAGLIGLYFAARLILFLPATQQRENITVWRTWPLTKGRVAACLVLGFFVTILHQIASAAASVLAHLFWPEPSAAGIPVLPSVRGHEDIRDVLALMHGGGPDWSKAIEFAPGGLLHGAAWAVGIYALALLYLRVAPEADAGATSDASSRVSRMLKSSTANPSTKAAGWRPGNL